MQLVHVITKHAIKSLSIMAFSHREKYQWHLRLALRARMVLALPGSSLQKNVVTKVYLTSPEHLKKCHNFYILHPILKTLPPLESTHLSRFNNILYYT